MLDFQERIFTPIRKDNVVQVTGLWRDVMRGHNEAYNGK
jgi:hypothetical protein